MGHFARLPELVNFASVLPDDLIVYVRKSLADNMLLETSDLFCELTTNGGNNPNVRQWVVYALQHRADWIQTLMGFLENETANALKTLSPATSSHSTQHQLQDLSVNAVIAFCQQRSIYN